LRNVVVIGGGLGGLITAIQIVRNGIPCTVIEKKSYPLHKVCGEYISNEAVPFLKRLGIYPEEFFPPQINRFQLSSVTGNHAIIKLDLGGFGISRYNFDLYLYKKAVEAGVKFHLDTEVTNVSFVKEKFIVTTPVNTIEADVVVGAFGKRSKLDVALNRDFIKKRSPFVGVKYHIRTDHPIDLIALHNFDLGYCGISNVEENVTNLCYLTHRDNVKRCGSVAAMENEVIFKNPFLKSVFNNSEFLFNKPEVINEISFETKRPVENNILMVGDAAGMITPLCGNGMAMAMHASKLASDLIVDFYKNRITRSTLEQTYSKQWRNNFSQRLWNGRQIQKLFGNTFLSNTCVNLALYLRPVANTMVRNTHGKPF
jgi:menaquinone-9 beta-reductase